MTISAAKKLTLKDRLSRLNFNQAKKLLKPNGEKLLKQGGYYEIDIDTDVNLSRHAFVVDLFDATVTVKLEDSAVSQLGWTCTCQHGTFKQVPCEHAGAVFSLILEEKTPLGLAKAPPERGAVETLSDEALFARALSERQQRAEKEKMRVVSQNKAELWTDYLVSSAGSGKTYRVALRGRELGDSFCSCPDFRKNTLGTCKHILHTLHKVEKRFSVVQRKKPFQQKELALHLHYGQNVELRLLRPEKLQEATRRALKPFDSQAITDISKLLKQLQKLERLGETVLIYPDAEEYIQQQLFQKHISARVSAIRKDPENHPLRTDLLNATLLPYQLDGIAFAMGAGRAVLADEMGLGKTIQGVGVAQLLAQEAGIKKVLVISPASLKSQWQDEIHRFCQRDCQVIIGRADQRAEQYAGDQFFSLCNYEQVLRDFRIIDQQYWDLIILDEGQRIKNWEAKTSQVIKALRSRFALVLTGTPLENRLDDLYSIIEFIDERRLGPGFRFYNKHRVVDESGKVIGYKNLAELREKLQPVLLRRTRASVQQQLPERTTEIIRIPPTEQQLEMHQGFRMTVSAVLSKRYITEMDLLRLQKALLMCRMSADSTYLVDKQSPGYSSKLKEVESLLGRLCQETDRKIILFSEWTTMLDLIEPLLEKLSVGYVRLDGSVPQKERKSLVHQFQNNDNCRLFLSTNAGAAGLNLQAANTVVNIDLPWNPALLEQRIARAHRMGQKRPIQVYILVTEQTLEENLLQTLSVKKQVAMAALDPDSDINEVDFSTGMDELKQRLEILLGAKPEAVEDVCTLHREQEALRQTKIADAGGQLFSAAFQFINEILPQGNSSEQTRQLSTALEAQLHECLQNTENGKLQLTINLPDKAALTNLASAMARMLTAG